MIQLFTFLFIQTGPFNLEPQSFETTRWIEFLENERADQTRFALGNARPYVVRFREIFREESVPPDLLWLALIESSFRHDPTSKTGAQGMYQFKKETARYFGLKVGRKVDERNDPYLSARTAAKYLLYLYNKFQDWDLVLAAYNLGEGDLRRAMKRRKVTTWKSIQPFLREETQQYVGKVKAAAIIGNRFMATLPADQASGRFQHYRIQRNDTLFTIGKKFKVSVESIRELNSLKGDGLTQGQLLMIPTPTAGPPSSKPSSSSKASLIYRVKKGDTLYAISVRFKISVEKLRRANNLKSNNIHPGQELTIPKGN